MSTTKVVIDTNIFVGALQRNDGVNRRILELCFLDELQPLMGDALYAEYQSLIGRQELYTDSALDGFFDDFCSICFWVDIYYRWRPNLKDEADNHVIELALAGGAPTIITWNKKDFRSADLLFPDLEMMTPVEFLKSQREKSKNN